MKTALQFVGLLCLAALFLLLFEAARLTHDLDKQMVNTASHINATLTDAQTAITNANNALGDVRREAVLYNESLGPVRMASLSRAAEKTIGNLAVTSHQLEQVSLKEQKYWETYPKQVSDLLAKASTAIDHTDASINTQVLPATTAAINQTTATVQSAAQSIQALNESLQPSLKALADTVGDPAIKDSLKNVDASTANLVVVTKNAGEITALGVKEMQQLTAPITKARAILMTMASFIGHLFGL